MSVARPDRRVATLGALWYAATMLADLRVLLVTYAFYPVGGAGVQRTVKLAKYLPGHGITPSVLTVKNPSVPITDASFSRDLPASLLVLRARTLEPGYWAKKEAWNGKSEQSSGPVGKLRRRLVQTARHMLVPDPQVLWLPGASVSLGRALVGPPGNDVALISAPPFSQYLLGPLLRLHPTKALVLDYRDEWRTSRTAYEMVAGRVANWAGEVLEARLLRYADAITTATEEFRETLLERFSFLDPASVRAIPNGYDPDDFPHPLPDPPHDRFVVTYAGTVFKLTSARGVLAAIRLLHEREPELARFLTVRFAGRIVETERPAFEGTEQLGVERLGYVPHAEVLSVLARSHLVLCLLDEIGGVERIYPAKIFELMHLGRPVLTVAPEGALTRLIRRHGLGTTVAPRDVVGIAEELARRLRAFRAAPETALCPELPIDTQRYHRQALAGEFAEVLRHAVARRRKHAGR